MIQLPGSSNISEPLTPTCIFQEQRKGEETKLRKGSYYMEIWPFLEGLKLLKKRKIQQRGSWGNKHPDPTLFLPFDFLALAHRPNPIEAREQGST
jgi:hypothetical protein